MGRAPRIIAVRPAAHVANVQRAPVMWPLISAAGLCTVGVIAVRLAELGPLSAIMAGHILVMNAISPLLALSLAGQRVLPRSLGRGSVLAAASILQIAVLWGAHAPPLLAHVSGTAHLLLQVILLATALFFWSAVLSQDGSHRWRSLLVLLITGKLFCLLGVLLVFAPRLVYGPLSHGHDGPAASPILADQQFAGLMMIVACPLSYILAAVVIAARWLSDIAQHDVAPCRVGRGDR